MRPDFFGLDFLVLIVKLLKKRTLKRSLFSRKPLEIESLADAQFVIDSCCLVSQSSYLSNSDKDCDWLILASFIREQMHADATLPRLGNKIWFENTKLNTWGN